MKKLIMLSVFGLMSYGMFAGKEIKKPAFRPAMWEVTCADGSYGGYFACDCTQTQANAIAHIMCQG